MSVIEHSQPDEEIVEIRLSTILAFLKKSRKTIILGAVAGGLIGAIYAFSKENEYTAQITVLPELQSKTGQSLGNLSSLAGLAGIDVGSMTNGSDAIRPELYPNVLQSAPFALTLFKKPIYISEAKQTRPFESYLSEKNKSLLLDWLSFGKSDADNASTADTGGLIKMTKEQETLAKTLQERVTGTFEKKSGVLTINAVMPDPVIAATIAQYTLTYLTDYVTTYRTEKARREVDFLNRQVAEAKRRYEVSEYNLSTYRDQNRSVYLNTAKIEEQRIQAEFLLSQDLYNTLSKQAEMAKIKVQEETPVFKVLEPARIPLRKSGPKRTTIVLAFILIGLILSILYSIAMNALHLSEE